MKFGATFSDCRRYRYKLSRIWQPARPQMCFVLLNPSTADETRDDPTIKRCITRAINAGYGGVEIVNLFAWRSTFPVNLYQAPDPVGSQNDDAIFEAARRAKLVICGWGKHGALRGRGEVVLRIIRQVATPHVLALNADGSPKHPLYIAYSVEPTPWL